MFFPASRGLTTAIRFGRSASSCCASSPRLRRRLLDTIDGSWRRIGRVDVVVGVDLALRTLNASTLEALLLGKMPGRFLDSEDAVDTRLATLSDRPEADGSYPVNELHCLPHMWPDVVGRLAPGADVVLIDLRRLRAANTGALFEVSLAVQRVPLDRIVLLVDGRTDERAVTEAIEQAWHRLPSGSPNVTVGKPQVRWLVCNGSHRAQDRRIGEAVFAAAFGEDGPRAAALPVAT